MGKKEIVYQTSFEVEHPDYPEVKMIMSNRLIDELLELYARLKKSVDEEKRDGRKDVYVMQLLGDYVLFYTEGGGEKIVFFLPFTLKKTALKKVLPLEYFIPYYEQLVAMATLDPHYAGGRVEFVPLKYYK